MMGTLKPPLNEAVAVLDAAGIPLACSRKFNEIMGLDGDGRAALKALLDGTALQNGLEDAGWTGEVTARSGERMNLQAERAAGLILVHAHSGDSGAGKAKLASAARAEVYARLSEGMAHDARNPLNAMAIHLELLRDKLANGAPLSATERHLTTMRDQVHRIDQILKRFLRFASPRREPPSTVDLAELVQQVVEVCGHDARRNGVRVESHLEVARVTGDVAQLGEAVLQLVMQGIVASPGGSVQIELGRSDGQAVLSLTDLPGAACPKPGAAPRSTELPLSLAEEIIEFHRGNFVARTEGGRTEVEVRLPLVVGE